MRIKFRTWNWKNNTLKVGIDYSVVGLDIVWLADPLGVLNTTYQGKKIFTQWVGLMDKNNVEIYEGDIVQYLRANQWDESEEKSVGLVGYDAGILICRDLKDNDTQRQYNDGGNEWYSVENSWEIEVVGNIYRNPELLLANEKTLVKSSK